MVGWRGSIGWSVRRTCNACKAAARPACPAQLPSCPGQGGGGTLDLPDGTSCMTLCFRPRQARNGDKLHTDETQGGGSLARHPVSMLLVFQ